MSESIVDIVRDMRKANFQPHMYQVWVNEFADRIEAAYKRELYEAESMEEIEVDRWTSSRCN